MEADVAFRCQRCGEVARVRTDAVVLRLVASTVAACAICNHCGHPHSNAVTTPTFMQLRDRGVPVVKLPPADIHIGPALTYDDIIDLHDALTDDALAELSGQVR